MSSQAQARENIASVIPTAKAQNEIRVRPIPFPKAEEILVRNYAIAVNPVDWKIQEYTFLVEKYPNVLGSDVAGIVGEVGSGVTLFKKGDRVTGYAGVIWNQNIDEGAYQTYTILHGNATAHIPASLSYEEAATFPMQVAYAGSALFLNLQLPLPKTDTLPRDYTGQGILVYGASSAIGTTLVQMTAQLGFTVFAVASEKHRDYITSLGASHFFARDSKTLTQDIVTSSKESKIALNYGIDCISEGTTFQIAGEIISLGRPQGRNAKLAVALPWPDKTPMPEGVEVKNTGAYQIFSDEPHVGKWLFNEYLTKQLRQASLKPSPPVRTVEGGLKAVQSAWELSKKGVSAQKLVLSL